MTTGRDTAHGGTSPADKIMSIEKLGRVADELRARGERIVLAHGAFDLLHFGHVRHLAAARKEGTVLIVTLTADAYVNKGPGRPVFPEHIRAEMVASLADVDYVGVNDAPSAENVLLAIKPDVYAKGKEYAAAETDVTGKIVSEREAVEREGGRIIFTDDLTFSSSSLLNKHFNIYDPILQQHLDVLRRDGGLDRLLGLLDKMQDLRVLVVGDTIIDEYRYVEAMGKASKENIIATRFEKQEIFAGGVVAFANHVASLCKHVDVVTCLGGRDSHESLVRNSLAKNARLSAVYRPDAPTTRKCRYVEHGYSMHKLFEVCYIDDSPFEPDIRASVEAAIAERIKDYDIVLVTDYGHGLIDEETVRQLTENAPMLAVNVQTNSANHGFNMVTKYPRADMVCIDGPEARLAVREKFDDLMTIVGEKLPNRLSSDRIIVTNGKHGCYIHERGQDVQHLPALTSTIVDTIGAGDAYFAAAGAATAAGASLADAAFFGNVAGALMVGIVGHRSSIDKASVAKSITALLK